MKITKAEFVTSAVTLSQCPQEFQPEIAMVGRSNVGKSSLINKLVKRKNLARTSSQPGKTQTLNFYHVNDSWFLVDLPGYGFARVSKEIRSTWGKFIEAYLAERPQLVGIIQIIDIRHEPSENDVMMREWLRKRNLPCLIVATKADKISRGQWARALKLIKDKLKLEPYEPVAVFSALSGTGLKEIESWIEDRISVYIRDNNDEEDINYEVDTSNEMNNDEGQE